MILPIIQVWDPILTSVAKTIEDIASYYIFIVDIKETLSDTGNWVWISAPQVWESIRLFLMHPRPTKKHPDQVDEWLTVVINPEIVAMSDEMTVGREGCLSISSQNGSWMLTTEVPRHQRVDVRFQSEQWEWIERRFEGFAAIIFQHEYDHLKWVLFLSRVVDWKSLRSS